MMTFFTVLGIITAIVLGLVIIGAVIFFGFMAVFWKSD